MPVGGLWTTLRTVGRAGASSTDAHGGEEVPLSDLRPQVHAQRPPPEACQEAPGAEEDATVETGGRETQAAAAVGVTIRPFTLPPLPPASRVPIHPRHNPNSHTVCAFLAFLYHLTVITRRSRVNTQCRPHRGRTGVLPVSDLYCTVSVCVTNTHLTAFVLCAFKHPSAVVTLCMGRFPTLFNLVGEQNILRFPVCAQAQVCVCCLVTFMFSDLSAHSD